MIHYKIAVITFLIWIVFHIISYPTTKYSKFGQKIFGGYTEFLMTQALILVIIPNTISLIIYIINK